MKRGKTHHCCVHIVLTANFLCNLSVYLSLQTAMLVIQLKNVKALTPGDGMATLAEAV